LRLLFENLNSEEKTEMYMILSTKMIEIEAL
jgi:hypothetical protein